MAANGFFIIRITESGPTPRHMLRHLRSIQREVWRSDGVLWHKDIRPKHFTSRGASEYHYRPRDGERGAAGSKGFRRSYTGRKLRRFGHTKPLVFTGTSQQLSRMRDVRATAKGARVVMRTPALNFKPKGWPHTLRQEMTAVSQLDEHKIIRNHEAELTRRLNAIRERTTQTL